MMYCTTGKSAVGGPLVQSRIRSASPTASLMSTRLFAVSRVMSEPVVTTTHDPALGGGARLIACFAGDGRVDVGGLEHQQVFVLQNPITRLGTADDADVKLDWTDHALGEIQHDEFDEYVYVQKSGDVPVRVDGQAVTRHPLRTGDRLEAGRWTLMYFRRCKSLNRTQHSHKKWTIRGGPGTADNVTNASGHSL